MPEYKIPEQLPPDFAQFDLVILDEASQSDITALAALARGKKALIVGDEKQVTPANPGIEALKINQLRAQFLSDLPNGNLIDENSSIFEITKQMYPDNDLMLREHFRCVAPIIQFSARFYDNQLVPLRVPKASERFDPPLVDVYLPGATRQGTTNASEARWIVEEVARLVNDPQQVERDIGIISLLGKDQTDKIGRLLLEHPRIGAEAMERHHIIYGDARTMQGQERSIVFLSMVATPREAQSQTSTDAEQRFNVALSRARDRLYLVRSVALDDLNPADIKAQVLQHFTHPLPDGRAITGSETEDLLERCDSGFEREVLTRLLTANYRARPQVAAGKFRIDIVVEGLEDRRLAIELDGDQFHGPDVWERDMRRQAALERAGWVFWRVFGSQWLADPDFWWADLCATLTRLGIEPIGAEARDERLTETILVDLSANDGGASSETTEPEEEEAEPAATTIEAEDLGAVGDGPTASDYGRVASSPVDSNSTLERQPLAAVDAAASAPPDLEAASHPIRVGDTVRLQQLGEKSEKLEITLIDDGNDPQSGLIGIHTPLGQALLDAEVGDEVEFRSGAYLNEIRILAVT